MTETEYREETYKTKIELYIDWVNNFVTLSRFAEYYSLTEDEALVIIDSGRELFRNKDGSDYE